MPTRQSNFPGNGSGGRAPIDGLTGAEPSDAPRARRRSPLPLAIVAALFIIMPFLAWYFTWFGRTLSDDDISKYLAEESSPRHVQHALSQIEARIEAGDAGAKRWYPQIVNLAQSKTMEIRQTAAWVMGQDNTSQEFHTALARLLEDSEPIVRRNAALGITRFGDNSGRRELLAVLQPFQVLAPVDGVLQSALSTGSTVSVGSLLSRIAGEDGRITEVRSPLPGTIDRVFVAEGKPLRASEPIASLAPDGRSVSEALRALRFVGGREDMGAITDYTKNMSERVKAEAALTVKTIESRVAGAK